MNKFTKSAGDALNKALEYARELGHTYVGSEHILLGLLSEKSSAACRILASGGVTFYRTKELISINFGKGTRSDINASDMTPRAKNIIENAYLTALGHSCPLTATEHILLAILREDDCAALRTIELQGASAEALISETISYCRSGSAIAGDSSADRISGKSVSSSLSRIGDYGKDLTAAARSSSLDPVAGRDEETERLIRILSRRTKNNPVLIGEPGVGKTAIVEGLAIRIARRNVPEFLESKIIFSVDLSSMIAGAKYRGDFEERMRRVINEAKNNRDLILFIDELHTILGAGSAEGAMDAANILKPVLARGEIQVIGATTLAEYRRIEKDSALERRFQSITVDEPSPEQTVDILFGLREKYELHHGVRIPDETVRKAVEMSVRYITDRHLPDKAIDLIDEAAAGARIRRLTCPRELKEAEEKISDLTRGMEIAVREEDFERAGKLRKERSEIEEIAEKQRESWSEKSSITLCAVEPEDVAEVITEWTGIPASELDMDERDRLLNLENELKKKIIGQDDAISALSEAIKLTKTGVRATDRPSGVFIFAGPTGVGKTETAKTIAKQIYGSTDSLIRFDMSEYMEKHTVSKLIGSPPGYVGFGEGGLLTESVRRRPYSLVLFDEIDKAHPDVLGILLQILDDGILTDSEGKKVSFRNAMIIMTTNIGAERIDGRKNRAGFSPAESAHAVRDAVMNELSAYLSPELLGRTDEIAVFTPLSDDSIKKIVCLRLDELCKRLEKQDISVTYSSSYAEKLAEKCFRARDGARSVNKSVRNHTEKDISEAMLRNNIKKDRRYLLDTDPDNGNFVISEVTESIR